MEPKTIVQIRARLGMFSFWSIKTLRADEGCRYECQIRADEYGYDYRKCYTATRSTPHDACRAAIAKATGKAPAKVTKKKPQPLRITQ